MDETVSFAPDHAAEPLEIPADHFTAPQAGVRPALDDVEFLDPGQSEVRARPPGPGLPESLLWILGLFVLQIVSQLLVAVVFAVAFFADSIRSAHELEGRFNGLNPGAKLVLVGLPNLISFLLLVGLGSWRLGKSPGRKLNLSSPSLLQVAIVASAVMPLSLISDALWHASMIPWQWCREQFPQLEFMEANNIQKFLEGLNGASLPMLLFFLAVVPAIGEEFVFRGLLGRGLVARWGIVRGVLITSALFAAVHIYPPHVAAVLPLGIMMHIAYLSTRSFWAPMLVHFINNGLAAITAALSTTSTDAADILQPTPLQADWLRYAALAYIVLCGWLLWRFRTEYVDEAGTPVWPGYHVTEHPDPALPLRRSAPNCVPVALLFSLLFLGQMVVVAHGIYQMIHAAPETITAPDAPESAAVEHGAVQEHHRNRSAASTSPLARVDRTVPTDSTTSRSRPAAELIRATCVDLRPPLADPVQTVSALRT